MNEETIDNYIGMKLSDRYEIISKIGEGGMSVVYRARDTRLERDVAVKILREELMSDEEFTQRFAAESHAVAMLSHPNIVAVYDVSHNDEMEYIVMELIDGITLKQYMNKKGAVNWKEVLHFSKQIAAALRHAHERGLIHRDIKPQNIMLLKDGTIKVADFGIAALENELGEAESLAIGSINYISPEQARGQSIDARTDIYSFGVVMYEMLAGSKPYSGKTLAEILVNQLNGNHIPVQEVNEEIPARLAEIVEKAIKPAADDRFSSASEMIDEFDAFTAEYLKKDKEDETGNPLKITVERTDNRKGIEFLKSLRRSRKIGYGLGTFALILSAILVFGFLWKYWLLDIFEPAVRVELPDFVGTSYSELSANQDLVSRYNFKVDYVVNTNYPGGVVLAQNPDPGRSLMVSSSGIDVELQVSTGFILSEVPDVTGLDFREAVLKLQTLGFVVETNNVTSSTVPKDTVVSTSPAAGEEISAGSTVYVDVSGGVEISYVKMPNLIGLSEDAAISKIAQYDLNFAGSQRQVSDYDAGTVIAQSKVAHCDVQEHEDISITVSAGPPVQSVHPEPDPYEVIQ